MKLTTAETKRYAELAAKLAAPEPKAKPKKAKATTCALPPAGWKCSRAAGHDGPCAARKIKPATSKPTSAK